MKHEEYEAESNISTVTQFVLLGFASLPNLQGILSAVFSIIYMIILIGNCLIILITRLDPTLHKPMYFFLANFSILEICYVSMCFFLMLGTDECFLLAVMSYDRYVAICNPLQYPLVMNSRKCTQLAAGSWLSGIPIQEIEHFFCDIPPILKLACGDTAVHELSVYVVVMVVAALPFILVLTSYIKIIATILRLPTAKGRAKAFSTCSSHLLVVVLFYGSATVTYLRPKSMHSPGTDKLLSLFYTIVTPMLNPLIYSLRNKEVIAALKRLFLKE
ncbi:Olfactory receptor 10AG1 [Lemmus lemmus]